MKNYRKLESIFNKVYNLDRISEKLIWDSKVVAPKGSSDTCAEQVSTIDSTICEILSSSEVGELIGAADPAILNDWQKADLNEMSRLRKHAVATPPDLRKAFSQASVKSETVWREAKKEKDYKKLLPYLKKTLDLAKEVASAKASFFGLELYDVCMDEYSPGMRVADLDPLFKELEFFLKDFLPEVLESQKSKETHLSDSALSLPANDQERLCRALAEKLGFDFNRGRLDVSMHPFMSGPRNDVRLTTNYNEKNFTRSLYGTIHEAGHGMYQQNLPEEYYSNPVGAPAGMAIHESQSLFWEMQIGRSREFVAFLLDFAKKNSINLSPELNEDDLYRTFNKVERSLIRVDADEVTYPLHVILRYKIEKDLIYDRLTLEELPGVWNDGMKKLIGIRPENSSVGCMQDIHWPSGSFGYFPSYSVGAIIACELAGSFAQESPDFLKPVSYGEFGHIGKFLNGKVHKFGSKYSQKDLISNITGGDLNLNNYKKYLRKRFIEEYLG